MWGMDGWKWASSRCLIWWDLNMFLTEALWAARPGHMGLITSLELEKRGLVFKLLFFSYSFSSSPIYMLLIHPPTPFPFSPCCFPPYFTLFSSCVFHMLSFLFFFFFFPTFFPHAMTDFSYNEKWHIVKVLYFPTSSLTHSQSGAKCSWCAARRTSCRATKLAPSHACTPGMHSHSMGFLSAISYVAGLLFLSGAGPSNYKSNYLEKLSLKTRGSKSIYYNPHLSGKKKKGKKFYIQNVIVITWNLAWQFEPFKTAV